MLATSLGHAGILIETRFGSVVCDPWFEPAFFGSWFVFPRNDRLSADLLARVEHADYLYISHLHADHLDEAWLAMHIRRDITVLLPGYPTRELERRMRALGFTAFIRTTDGEEIDLDGLRVAIHVETSITDGPGGDSALVVSDGETRLVNQNDCRTTDLDALRAHGPVDLHWLQYSGAIWYPMVYEETPQRMRELVDAKVESQFTRAMHYVAAIDATAVVPSAGPPCFLDPDLFHLNRITGDELSIFPDQVSFLERLHDAGRAGVLAIPGTTIDVTPEGCVAQHPLPDAEVAAIFSAKAAYLREYQRDWTPWMHDHRASWHAPTADLLATVVAWWEPLLAMAPTLRAAVGASCLLDLGDLRITIDFPAGRVRAAAEGDVHGFRFRIQRELVETVVAARALDWSNALFLSCRFHAWRAGPFNEYLYNFFKSLSVERMRRAESEARRKLDPPDGDEEIELGDYVMERTCPHRQADLSVFGEIDGDALVCTLHGWRFDLETGRCLTAADRSLRIRRRDSPAPVS
ncbi:MAG TPA: Rieske 2Fe-2S domain-containing protein [Ilumatobacteraceae bacterium]